MLLWQQLLLLLLLVQRGLREGHHRFGGGMRLCGRAAGQVECVLQSSLDDRR